MERRSARCKISSLKSCDRAIINQSKIEIVSRATLGKRLRDGVECIIMGFQKCIDTILN